MEENVIKQKEDNKKEAVRFKRITSFNFTQYSVLLARRWYRNHICRFSCVASRTP